MFVPDPTLRLRGKWLHHSFRVIRSATTTQLALKFNLSVILSAVSIVESTLHGLVYYVLRRRGCMRTSESKTTLSAMRKIIFGATSPFAACPTAAYVTLATSGLRPIAPMSNAPLQRPTSGRLDLWDSYYGIDLLRSSFSNGSLVSSASELSRRYIEAIGGTQGHIQYRYPVSPLSHSGFLGPPALACWPETAAALSSIFIYTSIPSSHWRVPPPTRHPPHLSANVHIDPLAQSFHPSCQENPNSVQSPVMPSRSSQPC